MSEAILLHDERRMPRRSLLYSLAGGAGAAVLAGYAAVRGLSALPVAMQVLGVLLLLTVLGQLPTLYSYASNPRRIAFGEQALHVGGRNYPYAEMTQLVFDQGSPYTQIRMTDGSSLLLRWDIWLRHAAWNALLRERTLAPLHAQAQAALARGEKVEFGKQTALDQRTLYLPKGSLPIDRIDELRFADAHDSGVDIRTLHVAGNGQQLTVDSSRLHNLHVLLALLEERLPTPVHGASISDQPSF